MSQGVWVVKYSCFPLRCISPRGSFKKLKTIPTSFWICHPGGSAFTKNKIPRSAGNGEDYGISTWSGGLKSRRGQCLSRIYKNASTTEASYIPPRYSHRARPDLSLLWRFNWAGPSRGRTFPILHSAAIPSSLKAQVVVGLSRSLSPSFAPAFGTTSCYLKSGLAPSLAE